MNDGTKQLINQWRSWFPTEILNKQINEYRSALINLVDALAFETDTMVDTDRFVRLDDAITQAKDIIKKYK